MKYMLMFTSEGDGRMDGVPPDQLQAMYARVGEWWTAHGASIREGHQLQPASTATSVDPRTGVVTDGPFIEAKESIGGYAIVEAPDLDAVIAMARTWPASPTVEIRPVLEREGM